MRPRKNASPRPTPKPKVETLNVTFHGLAAGGDAVGREAATGLTVFAPFGAPGDVAVVKVHNKQKRFAKGQIQLLKVAGPGRRETPCDYYRPKSPSESCGGCQIQHLNYPTQLELKRKIVSDALERIGHFRGDLAVTVEPCVASPSEWNYRNKADFVVGFRKGRPEVGFYARESHNLINIEACPLQCDLNNRVLTTIQEILRTRPDWAFNPINGKGDLRRVVMRSTSKGACHILLATQQARWLEANEFAARLTARIPEVAGVSQRAEGEFMREPHLIKGSATLEESVGELTLAARGEAFLQVNPGVSPLLVGTAMEMAALKPGTRALDLYCGVGMFALEMARRGAKTLGIEANPGAIVSAKENAERLSLDAEFIAGDVAQELEKIEPGTCDFVLLDPPRAGAAEAVPHLLRLRPARLVYVSCDPATLARDLRQLTEGGYKINRVVPLDMFPQTAHVETVVGLELASE